jgi:hypothetical protein
MASRIRLSAKESRGAAQKSDSPFLLTGTISP